MPHRQKNKHKARHRAHDVKPASLPKPLLAIPQTVAPTILPQKEPEPLATPTSPLDSDVGIGNA
jgi:hypothetical protein